jgi:ParB family transcriptional regulator, chromosome partitioning protein
MDTAVPEAPEVDLHRIELRFADARLLEPQAVDALARSIEQNGQLIACIAVPEEGSNRLILIDGYRRILALRRLGRDTACVESWACDLAQALLRVLARASARPFAALEEALLLRELVHGQGLSEREVARRSGRDVSWVSRRLELVCAVPDLLLAAVRKGALSTWAATRVLAPLARANTEHAAQLLDALASSPLSSRELHTWFQHYLHTPRAARERMVSHPRLFIQTLKARDEQRADTRLREGPEGQCAADVRQMLALIQRLRPCLPTLSLQTLPEALLSALTRLRSALDALQSELARSFEHDPQPDPRCCANPASPRPEPARNQPGAEALA